MTQDKPMIGILLMFGFCILAPLGDGIAKLLSASLPLLGLLAARFVIQAVILLPIVLFARLSLVPNKRVLRLTVIRTILHILGIGGMFLSLRYLPLADAVAIAFVMPFILLVLGRTFLNEQIGQRRIIACAIGFAGTLLVIQPSFASVGWPALLPLFVAVVFALFILVTRMVAKDVDPMVLQTLSGAMASVILLPLVLFLYGLDFAKPVSPPFGPPRYDLIVTLGIVGTVAHLLMTWSLRFAPSATLAPMQYLEIPFAVIVGWLFFREFPNGLALVGILIIVSAGLFIVWREQIVARKLAKTA
jgi:drug/metabolite transporter (DMT)-like permease